MIRLGSAAAPRWYDRSAERLPAFIAALEAWGATGMEVVLHHGPADDRAARVHLLHEDWEQAVSAYLERGLRLDVHNSLEPRFALDRWATDPAGLTDDVGRLLDQAAGIAERQGEPVAFVVHGAQPGGERDPVETTAFFLDWAGKRLEGSGVTVALELRPQRTADTAGADGSRETLVQVVRSVGRENVGICWDLGHDWENGQDDPAWRPLPDDEFLDLVTHVHAHDAGPEGRVHFPLTQHRVPFEEQLAALPARGYRRSVTMEIRWRYAASLGEPWDLMAESYGAAKPLLESSTPVTNGRELG